MSNQQKKRNENKEGRGEGRGGRECMESVDERRAWETIKNHRRWVEIIETG